MTDPVYLSKEGLRKLEAELKRLKLEERPKVVTEIKRARELGDIAENAEYRAAKEAQTRVERRISDLEHRLSRVRTVDADRIPDDKVHLFAKTLVKDQGGSEEIEYTIVPPEEADVDNGIISVKSPIGAALSRARRRRDNRARPAVGCQ